MSSDSTWDGVIRHQTRPGNAGYKRHHCRCPDCMKAGEEINARNRARKKRMRAERLTKEFTHGLGGYRDYGCRCEVCSEAGRAFNIENRDRARARRERKKAAMVEQMLREAALAQPANPAPIEAVLVDLSLVQPAVDWSEIEHLKPGAGVRRRTRQDS
jgi:hypothetical protein